jgi:hypothetical protein
MAKTRFRRKSHGKKNKTARRQKRQSRRMRGGDPVYTIDRHNVLQWARRNPNCFLTVSPETAGFFSTKQVKGSMIRDQNLDITRLKNSQNINSNISNNALVLTSPCDNIQTYDRT